MIGKKLETDMTSGVIWKHLLRFFIPIFLSALFQQIYYITDAFIVGNFAGKEPFGAIDAIGSLIKLPMNFFLGLSAGASVVISHYFGAKDEDNMPSAVQVTAMITLVFGAVLTAVGVIFSPAILTAMKTPEGVFPFAVDYTRIYFSGILFSLVYNMGAGVLRAAGDSKRPFYCLSISCGVNIILDLIFVALLGMRAAGAALATVLSQLVSAVLVTRALICSRASYRLTINNFRVDWAKTGHILKLGIPIGIQSSLYSVANIMVQSAINGFGTDAVAAWGICGKLDFIIWLIMDALGIAMSTFAAQNYGAGRTDRLRKGVLSCTLISFATVAPVSALLFFLAEPLGRLFLDDSRVIEISTHLMRTFMTPLYFTYIGGEVLSGAIRGTGETFKPMLITLICTCAIRVVWVLTAVPIHHTLDTVITSYPLTWIISSLVFVIYYKSGGWLKKKNTP